MLPFARSPLSIPTFNLKSSISSPSRLTSVVAALVPLFASIQEQHPINCVNGLPDLQPDLSWAKGVPFYVMGAFAQLQLGPDALNLAGARSGSVVVTRAMLAERKAALPPPPPLEEDTESESMETATTIET